jgi:hypothetical protein
MQGICSRVVLLLLLGVLTAPARADDDKPKARQMEFDPVTGEWVESPPPVEGTALGDYKLAAHELAQDEPEKAYRRIKKWHKTYGEGDLLYPDALLLRARCRIALEDYYKAHEDLVILMDQFPNTDAGAQAVLYEFMVAEEFLVAGKRRKVVGIPLLSGEDTGLESLDRISTEFPQSPMAEQAVKTKADFFYEKSDFSLAELEYARLTQQFPRGKYRRYGTRRSADSALARFTGVEFDDAPLIEAEERYRTYLLEYPGVAEQEGIGLRMDQISAQRAEKEYLIARFYEKTKHPKSAVFYYQSVVRNWPESIAAGRARERLAELATAVEPESASQPAGSESES